METVHALRPGILFYEMFGDTINEFVCLSAPAQVEAGLWEWEARVSCGPPSKEVITFAIREGWELYVPHLSLIPEFDK